jgi:hypothetical protein
MSDDASKEKDSKNELDTHGSLIFLTVFNI